MRWTGPVLLLWTSSPSAVSAPSTPALKGCPGGEAEERSLQVAPPPDQPWSRTLSPAGNLHRLASFPPRSRSPGAHPRTCLRTGIWRVFVFSTADYARPRPFRAALTSREDPSGVRVHRTVMRHPRGIIPGYHDEGGGGTRPKLPLNHQTTNNGDDNRAALYSQE